MSRKGVLLILDGYGEGKKDPFNAVINAKTPFLDKIKARSHSLLKTDGEAVGIFEGELGGSEVGHTTIGAGRIVPSTAKAIHDDMLADKLKDNKILVDAFNFLEKNGGNLHLWGLCSDKNIHSDINTAIMLATLASKHAKNVFFHFITDGRDTGSKDSEKYLKMLVESTKNLKNFHIVSVAGRGYPMDRENNMDRIELALKYMFDGKSGEIEQKDILNYIKMQYEKGVNDQFVLPIHVKTDADAHLTKNDVFLVFNFREDRVRQMAGEIKKYPCRLITMSSVGNVETEVLYPAKKVEMTLSEHLSNEFKTQVKISETTKYAHVTYFLNGGEEKPFLGEDRVHIPTIKVEDFASTPKMRAKGITKATKKAIKTGYDAVIVNYSNPDMIGHTGNYEAVVKSLEYLDKCVKKVVKKALKNDYFVLITADHGNCETMRLPDGSPHMAHTLNLVECVIVDKVEHKMKKYGGLKDVAPTFLDLMEVKPNPKFEGKSLIRG